MKKTTFVVSIVLILTLVFAPFSALAYTPTFEVGGENALLINPDTQDVLYSSGADERISPASTVFLMVALVVCDNVADMTQSFEVDTTPRTTLSGTGALVSDIRKDEQLTYDQLMHFLLISSYNDVALFLAEKVAGDTETFVELMNERAKSLGMKDTQFTTPIGLTREDQYTTVNDLYKLAKVVFENDYLVGVMNRSRYSVPATNKSGSRILSNTNYMVDSYTSYYYKYMVAGKTGNGDEGRCLVSMATKDSTNFICIVARCDSSTRNEFKDTKNLYEWAFNNFRYKTVVTKGEMLPVSVPVELSWDRDSLTLAAGQTVIALLPKDADLSTVEYRAELVGETVDAPIKDGDILGTVDIVFANEVIGVVELVATENIEGSFVLGVWRFLSRIIGNIFVQIALIMLALGFVALTIVANVKAKRERDKKLRLKKRL